MRTYYVFYKINFRGSRAHFRVLMSDLTPKGYTLAAKVPAHSLTEALKEALRAGIGINT